MHNFGTLYRYEMEKILRKKIVWITIAVVLFIILMIVGAELFGDYYVDGVKADTHFHMFQVDKAYQKELDGRAIDQSLLEEMQEGYGKIPADADRYTLTEEYQTYARPYSVISNFVRVSTGMNTSDIRQWEPDEQELYRLNQLALEKEWDNYYLTQKEKDFWESQEENLEWPVIFRYKEGWWELFDCMNTIGLLALIAVSICLASVFTEEHSRKTDQLILCSKYGRKTVYWAKFLAGTVFSFLMCLLFIGAAFIEAFVLYGNEGFTAAFQLIDPVYAYSLSVGGAVLISYGIMIAAVVVTGAFVMMLSELIRSNIGTLSIAVGMVFLSLFINMPAQYRILSQLWSYLPSEYVAVWNIYSPQTVPLFGKILLSWQVVPVLYFVCVGIFALIGKNRFTGYQVSGR